MTIHKASKDPVLIKKIALKIWSLRTEIEEVIRFRLKEAENREVSSPPLKDLIDEYQGNVSPQDIEAIFKNLSSDEEGEESEEEEEEEEEEDESTEL